MMEAVFKKNGTVTTDVEEIKREVFLFYQELYSKEKCEPNSNPQMNLIANEENVELTKLSCRL